MYYLHHGNITSDYEYHSTQTDVKVDYQPDQVVYRAWVATEDDTQPSMSAHNGRRQFLLRAMPYTASVPPEDYYATTYFGKLRNFSGKAPVETNTWTDFNYFIRPYKSYHYVERDDVINYIDTCRDRIRDNSWLGSSGEMSRNIMHIFTIIIL